MENFNDIKNKFETAFNAIEGEKTEFNLDQEYENIGVTAKASEYLPRDQHPLNTQKRFKPPQPTPRQSQMLSNNEYENVIYPNQNLTGNTKPLNRAVRKKKTKRPRTKPLEILPSIDESFAKLSLNLSEPEYANIVPENFPTERFIPDKLVPQTKLDENDVDPQQAFSQTSNEYEYELNNSLYIDFFQRVGLSPTESFSEVKPLITTHLRMENQPFPTQKNLSEPILATSANPVLSKSKLKKPSSNLHSFKADDEPIFANITKFNPDGTIEWESWQAEPSASSKPIQANLKPESKLSKFLPKNLNFWSKPLKKKQETLEESNALEEKKPFTALR